MLVVDGTQGLTFNDASLQGAAASPYVLKNRIINGDMRIDQRNAGASGTALSYTVDRWYYFASQISKFTWQQNAGSVTPPASFTNYLGFTSSSAYTVLTSDYFNIEQRIEGFNVADLAWGTANAKTITLSFWARSSLTGTFGGSITNSAGSRSYAYTYTISSANTWEQKTVTIAGDTTGTWLSTNGTGMRVIFSLGVGSTYAGTAGSWASTDYEGATGQTQVVGTNGATFYLTGVQLEIGTTATPFERRLYGQELANCQRYYEMSYDIGTVPATATGIGAVYGSGSIGGPTTSFISTGYSYKVTKRATPTNTYYDLSGNSGKCNREQFGSASTANQNLAVSYTGINNATIYSNGTASSSSISFHYTSSAEL